ncbi:hypothetical protein HD806DRAFT_351339 [Xylariaceae sp. AK1471]|nr:hypothetical protein HD806DRAFT_351339 [Xylariaceae sp. AK1471]
MPNQSLPPAYTTRAHQTSSFDSKKALYRHKSTFVFTVLFLSLLVIPWVILSILNFRPIGKGNARSWHVVDGTISEDAVHTSDGLFRAAVALNTAAALLTIPIVSMVFNHAAVAVVQRRHPGQQLNALETLSLADSPWSRLRFASHLSTYTRSLGLAYAPNALLAVGFLQLILQSALVTSEQIRVTTYDDVPAISYDLLRQISLGCDSTPETLSKVPVALVTKEVAARLSTETEYRDRPGLWSSDQSSFASAFSSSIDTGVLRYHAMRLNSSIQCEEVSKDTFPEICPGPRPFNGSLSLPDMDDFGYARPPVVIRWCTPGTYDASPWSLSRNRQDITEEFFIDVYQPNKWDSAFFGESFTTYCLAKTTRGAFELPNYHNNFIAGPLLDNLPDAQDPATTNDQFPKPKSIPNWVNSPAQADVNYRWPYSTNFPYDNLQQVTPGPLATVMISMLGNESWIVPLQNISETSESSTLETISRAMCTGGIPLLSWQGSVFSTHEDGCRLHIDSHGEYTWSGHTLSDITYQTFGWFESFRATYPSLNSTLASALSIANEATLSRAAALNYPGNIYTSPGALLHKPNISLPAQIVISSLIGVETLVLIGLLVFIYLSPTFTRRLDAFMVATIGAQLYSVGATLPHLGEAGKEWHEHLREHDGVIGFSHGHLADEDSNASSVRENAHGQASDGTSGANAIEMGDLNNPAPSRILIIGGIGSVSRAPGGSKPRTSTTANEV